MTTQTMHSLVQQKQIDTKPPKHMRSKNIEDAQLSVDLIDDFARKHDLTLEDAALRFFQINPELFTEDEKLRAMLYKEQARLSFDFMKSTATDKKQVDVNQKRISEVVIREYDPEIDGPAAVSYSPETEETSED